MCAKHATAQVPNVVGLGAEEACAVVREMRLVPKGPDMRDEPVAGIVTAQEPVAGTGVERDSPVVLWTRGGSGPSGAFVPTDPVVGSKPLEPV